MRRLVRSGCVAAIIALSGCASLTDHPKIRSQIDLNGSRGAFLGNEAGVFAGSDVPEDWWRMYQDPTLDRLVQDAMLANTDLRVAAASLVRSQAAQRLASAAREPQTSLGFTPGISRESAEEQLKGTEPLPSAWVYNLQASVSYQVDLFGQVARSVEAADADVAASQAARDAVRVTVIAETTRAYVEACSLSREIRVSLRQLEIQARRVALTQRLTDGGRAIDLDVVRLAAQEDQLSANVPQLVARKKVALFRLAALTGRTPTELPAAAESCQEEPRINSPLPIGDGAALLGRRPDVRQAERSLRATHARVGVAMGDLYPKVILGASIGSAGLLKDALDAGTNKFSLGPLISWQFPNRSNAKARILEQQADEEAASARFDGVLLTALKETESALVVYARDLDARASLEAARRKTQRAAADIERLFAGGRQTFSAVLDATRSSIESEQAVAAMDTRLAADQVALFLALGGGWQSASPVR